MPRATAATAVCATLAVAVHAHVTGPAGPGIWAVVFSGHSVKDQPDAFMGCEASQSGDVALVTQLPDTGGLCAPLHGAAAATPYYSLERGNDGSLTEVKFMCANRNCSGCMAETTSLNGCITMPTLNRSVSFRGGSTPNLLPTSSGNATSESVSIMWYTTCGESDALREIHAITPGNGSATCTQIATDSTVPLYQSLYTARDDETAVSGGWMCASNTCAPSSCALVFNRHYVGTSIEAGQNGCYMIESTDGLDEDAGPQAPCSCAVNHVYYGTYTSDNVQGRSCGFGQRYEQVVISSLRVGSSQYTSPTDPTDSYYRYLAVDFDAATQKSKVTKLGLDCESGSSNRCKYERSHPLFSQCYTVSALDGSVALFPPDDICYGSSNLKLEPGGVALYWFTSNSCPTDLSYDPTTMLTIRGYPQPTGRCMSDGDRMGSWGFYSLSVTENSLGTRYSGRFRCNANCSDCAIEAKSWYEGQCYITSEGSFQIFPITQLVQCAGAGPGPSPPTSPIPGPPTSPGTVPAQNLMENQAVLIGSSAGAVVLVMGALSFLYYQRGRRYRSEYEALGGSERAQRQWARAEAARQKKRRTGRQSTDEAETTFYNGI
eukprot:m.77998 g.77998  ORF g.77998 m.77998 type:complete len:603 (+) comp9182_c0_seq1:270-2078(+)